MKANEFVKKFGIEEAKEFLNSPHWSIDQLMMLQSGLRCEELQRLVESHELVEKCGGVDGGRSIIGNAPNDSTHIKINLGLCIYYCQSSSDEGDQAGLWIDEDVGYWGLSSYQNYELSIAENRFISIAEVRKAIADVEACQ